MKLYNQILNAGRERFLELAAQDERLLKDPDANSHYLHEAVRTRFPELNPHQLISLMKEKPEILDQEPTSGFSLREMVANRLINTIYDDLQKEFEPTGEYEDDEEYDPPTFG